MKRLIIFLSVFTSLILVIGFAASAQITQVTSSASAKFDSTTTRKIVKDNGGNYYVVFSATYNSFSHIFVRKSTDGGSTWKVWNGTAFTTSGEVPIESLGSINQTMPAIVIDGNNYLHVIWVYQGYTLYYSKYNGSSWSAPLSIATGSGGSGAMGPPSIAVDSNNYLHVVYDMHEDGYDEYGSWTSYWIRYLKYTTSWSSPLDLESLTDSFLGNSKVVVDGSNNVHVVWTENVGGYNQIIHKKYAGSWLSNDTLTTGSYNQDYADIDVDSSNNIYVVWQGTCAASPTNTLIRYSKYTTSWSAPVALTSSSYNSLHPTIAVYSSNNVNVLWAGNSAASPGNYQIQYSQYTTSWSSPVGITSGTNNLLYPSAAIGASAYTWQGLTNSSGVSSNTNGVMFSTLIAPNQNPVISLSTPATNQTYSAQAGSKTITITGKVSDPDANNVTVSATINGKTKTVTVSNAPTSPPGSPNFTLTWDVAADSIAENTYSNISVGANDGAGGTASVTLAPDLVVDKTAPTVSAPTATDTQTTTIDVQVSANDTAAPIQYLFNIGGVDKSWQPGNSYTFTSLTPNTAYVIKYKAQDSVGNISAYSQVLNVTTLAVAPPSSLTAPTATDASNYGNAKDIKVTFTAPSDESKIKEYRIFIVPSGTSFDEPTASTIKDITKYNLEKKSRISSIKKHMVTLKYNLKDVNGNAINTATDYYAYVLAVGVAPNANDLSPISAQSIRLNNTAGGVDSVTGLSVVDLGSNNNGSDLVIKFSKASNETPIKEYKVFIVPQAQGALNLTNAITKANTTTNYIKVTAANRVTTKTYTVKPTSSQVDSTGVAVTGGTYNVYVLSVPKNVNVRYYNLSGPVSVTIQ